MIAAAVDEFGRVDVRAATSPASRRRGCSPTSRIEDYDRTMNVDLRGVLLGMKHGIRAMLADGGGGSIVNWSSIGGLNASPATERLLGAAKAGVIAVTKAAAVEYGTQGHPRQRDLPGFHPDRDHGRRRPRDVPGIAEKARAAPRGRTARGRRGRRVPRVRPRVVRHRGDHPRRRRLDRPRSADASTRKSPMSTTTSASRTTPTTSTSTPTRIRCIRRLREERAALPQRGRTTSTRSAATRTRARARRRQALHLGSRRDARAHQGRHRDATGRRSSSRTRRSTRHTASLLSRVFTPTPMSALEPKIREFCAAQPRPARRHASEFDLDPRLRRADADARDRHAVRHPRSRSGGDPRARRHDAAHRGGQADAGLGRAVVRR